VELPNVEAELAGRGARAGHHAADLEPVRSGVVDSLANLLVPATKRHEVAFFDLGHHCTVRHVAVRVKERHLIRKKREYLQLLEWYLTSDHSRQRGHVQSIDRRSTIKQKSYGQTFKSTVKRV
jgi:hypothetical protein